MKDISNTTIAILMVVAIVTSVGGLYLSLSKLGQSPLTGYAIGGSGQVNITILNFNSITIDDSQINFGNCTPTSGTGNNVSSNETSAPTCIAASSGTYPDNISVSNDGNTNINVTVQTNVLASTLLGGTTPDLLFSTRNSTYYGGCSNRSSTCAPTGDCGCNTQDNCTVQWNWLSLGTAAHEYEACKNLTFGGTSGTRPRFYLFARVFVPADATPKISANATFTFTAHSPS